ncbi:MAG: type IX secretion system sortase PorU [candidate division Zixibacteria bacterium]|nr:type IX secretion system sortase PorU [candidate division Zixibacteria bacterium]
MTCRLCKSFILLCLVILLGVLSVNGADLQVVSSSDTLFHFVLTLDDDDLLSHAETDSLQSHFYSVQVGLPHLAQPHLRFAEGRSLGSMDATKMAVEMSSTSHPLVEVLPPRTIRDRRLVSINIYPVTGSMMFHEVEVQLSFDGGRSIVGAPANDPLFDRIFKAAVANYQQFRQWQVPVRVMAKPTASVGPFSGAEEWYRIEVNQTGLYGLTGTQLEEAGVNLGNLSSDHIHLLNGSGLILPINNNTDRPTLEEISIIVADGGDGLFGHDDTVFFFGEAVDRWLYQVAYVPRFVNNVYENANVYWLNISDDTPVRMSEVGASPELPTDTLVTTFRRYRHSEQDNILRKLKNGRLSDYYTWYWTDSTLLELFVTTPGAVEGARARIKTDGRTYNPGYMDLWVNGVPAVDTCNQFNCRFGVSSLHDGLNEIRIDLHGSTEADPFFNYLNIEYISLLVPEGNVLDITLEPFAGRARMDVVDNFNAPLMILNLADPHHPTLLTGVEHSGGSVSFSAMIDPLLSNRFYLARRSGPLAPLSIERSWPTDLYATDRQVDLIIISSRDLIGALDEYVEYRQNGERSISVVAVEDIYDNFSWGLFDPAAIRDFLKYAYESYPTPAPSSVLLVGDGTYDYLDHFGTGFVNRVPSWILPSEESTSDDAYVYFGTYGLLDSDTTYMTGDRGFDMLVARWPVRTVEEINTIVAKSKHYESPSNLGLWRNRITFVADDEHTDTGHDETFHANQTEQLSRGYTPRSFLRNKIYIWDYPFVGRYKPTANPDIVAAFNNGSLIINYVGHGNPELWAHEHVFTRLEDLPQLSNYDRLPLVFVASCAIGFFDEPLNDAMAEDLLVHPAGGAIGVISAARIVYSSDNAVFNQTVFSALFEDDSLTIAEAMYLAKLRRQYANPDSPIPVTNDRIYVFFGDPCLSLGQPRLDIEITTCPDSLIALDRARVAGRVINHDGQTLMADGQLSINIYDSDRPKTYRNIDYFVSGPTLYRGTTAITAGDFDFEFVTPLDVGYGGHGGRIVLYAQLGNTDAIGLADSLRIADNAAASTDSTGPEIEYGLEGSNQFVSGDVVLRSDRLEIVLTDPSGVNLSGALGHGITLTIDGQSENQIDLTSSFSHDQGDFSTGSLEYPLDELEPGRHTFKVKAWDNANNSSSTEFVAEIMVSSEAAIADLLNFPNPMNDMTRFSCRLTQPMKRLSLAIFTLSGRKIKTFERYPVEAGYFDDIIWYGLDAAGDRVATGVYIYKAIAVPSNGGEVVEALGKIVVVN